MPRMRGRSEEVVTVCPRRERPIVLTFVVTRGTDCEPQVDRVERVRRQLPEVDFVTVVSGDTREETRGARPSARLAPAGGRGRGRLGGEPVRHRRSARSRSSHEAGGVRQTSLGNLTEDELRRRAERLAG